MFVAGYGAARLTHPTRYDDFFRRLPILDAIGGDAQALTGDLDVLE